MLSAFVAGVAALWLAGCGSSDNDGGGDGGGGGGGDGGGDGGSPALFDRLTMGIWEQESMPLTMQAAKDAEWISVGGDTCDPSFGHRYRKSAQRITPTLIYNNLGEIAGFQGVVNTSTFPLYPTTNLQIGDVQNLGQDEAGHTFFFKDPAKICSASVTLKQRGDSRRVYSNPVGSLLHSLLRGPKTEAVDTVPSLGDRLWVRKCENCGTAQESITYDNIPFDISGNDTLPDNYTKGGCAPTGFLDAAPGNPTAPRFPKTPGMGTHWWKNMEGPLGRDVATEDAGPLFFLYSEGKLRAMGFVYASGSDLNVPTVDAVMPKRTPANTWAMDNGELWEFATQPLYPHFFSQEQMPRFLDNLNTFDSSLTNVTTGTMHIFFSDHQTINCP